MSSRVEGSSLNRFPGAQILKTEGRTIEPHTWKSPEIPWRARRRGRYGYCNELYNSATETSSLSGAPYFRAETGLQRSVGEVLMAQRRYVCVGTLWNWCRCGHSGRAHDLKVIETGPVRARRNTPPPSAQNPPSWRSGAMCGYRCFINEARFCAYTPTPHRRVAVARQRTRGVRRAAKPSRACP